MNTNHDGSVIINTVLDVTGVKRGVSEVNNLLRKTTGGVLDLEREFQKLGATAKKVGTLIGGAFAVSKLVSFAKECVELGSDLAEVQNVVDSVFTSMSDSVNDWAKNAANAFGLSETMAKQYVGTYGAMAKAFGFTEKQAYDMSTALTGLAGDVASFYNLDQDVAYTKLKSVFSGETESLKDLGIVMSQAALDAYAVEQGLGKTTAKMTEQEKVALRYKFIMEQLSTASGDFAKTSDGWANQTRILRLEVDSLKASLGAGLINLFTPALKVINAVLSKLATLANAFKAFTELITGKKATTGKGSSGIADTYNDAADGANALADATDKTTKATKKANKAQKEYLSGLDEIHKFTKDDTTSFADSTPASSGTGGLVDIGGSAVDYGKMAEGKTVVDDLADSFSKLADLLKKKDWEGLGEYMAEGINKGLKKVYNMINWDNVGPKITEVITAITRTFNSFVDNLDWAQLGRTVGAGINTVVNTLRTGIEGINWYNLGLKLGTGLTSMIKEVNWGSLGNLLGDKFMIAWNVFGGWVEGLDFDGVGKAVAEALNGVFEKIDLKKIGLYLKKAINGAFYALRSFTRSFDWKWAAENVVSGLNEVFEGIEWKEAGKTLEEFWDGIDEFILKVAEDTDWEALGKGIGDFLSEIDWVEHLQTMVTVVSEVIGGIWEGLGETAAGKFIHGIAFFAIGTKLLGFVNRITTLLTGKSATSKLLEGLSTMLGNSITEAGSSSTVTSALKTLGDKIAGFFGSDSVVAAGTAALQVFGIPAIVAGSIELAKLVEVAQGGNGIITAFGTACHDLVTELARMGNISKTQYDEIEALIEEWEEAGYSNTEMADLLIQKLNEFGVSSETAQRILASYDWQIQMTEESTKALTEKVGDLGESFSKNADKLDFSVYEDGRDVMQRMNTVLNNAIDCGDDLGYIYSWLATIMGEELENEAQTAQGAFDHLVQVMEDAGYPADTLIELLKDAFPEAANAAQEAATQTADDIDDITFFE